MNTTPPDYEWFSKLYGFQPDTQCVAQEAVGISPNVAKAATAMAGDFWHFLASKFHDLES